VRRPLLPPRRALIPVASLLLALGGISALWPSAVPDSASLADELHPATWAMTVPSAWLAAPVPPVRRGDAIDILAMRGGDKAYSVPVAYGVRVISVTDRGLLLEVDETDATAIATARGGGLLLVPLLRSTR
jgi:hypothetical protein